MSKMTRAQFIGLSSVLAGALGYSRSPEAEAQITSGQSGTAPDLVVLNARVYTIDNAQPKAEAFAIKEQVRCHR